MSSGTVPPAGSNDPTGNPHPPQSEPVPCEQEPTTPPATPLGDVEEEATE